MVIEWNNKKGALRGCIVENKIKIYPEDRTLILGKIKDGDAYNMLKEAWIKDDILTTYRFVVSMNEEWSIYTINGWKIIG